MLLAFLSVERENAVSLENNIKFFRFKCITMQSDYFKIIFQLKIYLHCNPIINKGHFLKNYIVLGFQQLTSFV